MTTKCRGTILPDDREYMDAFASRAENMRVPLSGSLELTHRCNLNCVHCYLGPVEKRQAQAAMEMDTARICSLLDEITEAGCLNLLITGGEPFLRRDFPEIYRRAKGNGLLVTIFSNGTMVDEETVALFHELPPLEVEISLYGATAGTYERVTRVPGSYERCMQGIKGLLQNGIRVNLKTVLMTLNSHELSDMEKMAAEFGVRFRFDAAITPSMDGDAGPLGLRVSPEEAIEKEMSNPETVRKWGAFHERSKDCRLGPNLYECGAGGSVFHVDPYGGLMPCMMTTHFRYDMTEGGFMTGWDSYIPGIKTVRTASDSTCRGCKKINLCSYCPAFFRLENGTEGERSEYLCRMGGLRFDYISNSVLKGEHRGQP